MTANVTSADFSCAAVRERLGVHLLEPISALEVERLERHLAGCDACRVEAREQGDLLALLPRSLPPSEPPPAVLADLLRRVRASHSGGPGRGARAGLPRRSWPMAIGMAASIAAAAVLVLVAAPRRAEPLTAALESPDVAVINLFASIDSPLSARYEFRTEAPVRLDRSVGRILFNVTSGEWRLLVHGLPRPPRGAHYVLTAEAGGRARALGLIERWESGVARLEGAADFDLTRTERISVELVASTTRVRLLEAISGAW